MPLGDQELVDALNYLGRPVSVSLRGTSTPSEGPGGLPAAPTMAGGDAPAMGGNRAPSATGGESPATLQRQALQALTAATGDGTGSGAGAADIGGSGTFATTQLPNRPADPGSSNIQNIIGAAGKAGKLVSEVFPAADISHAMSPETREVFQAQRAGERGDFTPTNIPESGPGSFENMQRYGEFGEIGPAATGVLDAIPDAFSNPGGVAESMGEWSGAPFEPSAPGGFDWAGSALPYLGAGLGTALSAYSAANATNDFDKAQDALHAALYAASPFTAGITGIAAGAADALDSIIQMAGGPSLSQFLGFAPSDDWMAFAPTLAGNLGTTQRAITDLTSNIVSAQTPEALQKAAGQYRNVIGSFAGGFGQGAGPYDIPGPPGATGTQHEGGIQMDFGPLMTHINDLMQARKTFMESPNQQTHDWQAASVQNINAELSRLAKLYPKKGPPPDLAAERAAYLAANDLPQDYGQHTESSGA